MLANCLPIQIYNQTYVKTDQIMVCGVLFLVTNTSITMGFVYARNLLTERRELWDLTSSLFQSSPWIFLGDFNQILSMSEAYSLSPSPISIEGLLDLQDCLDTSRIFDLASRDCQFTWTNRSPTSPKARKLGI